MSALDDIRQRAAVWVRPTYADRDRLIAALDAVLALADNLDAEAVGAENMRIELMKEPRTNGMRQQIYAYGQIAASSRSGAYRIRAVVNDALEQ